jgi:hypothetical protein
MSSRSSQVVAAIVLLVCLICPVLEIFDSWDHTLQTGNDTEYTLVVIAVCAGAGFSVFRFTSFLTLAALESKVYPACLWAWLSVRRPGCLFVIPASLSPPILAFRV